MPEHLRQDLVVPAIFLIQGANSQVVVSGGAIQSIPIDTQTLSLGYANFDYSDTICETAVSPVQATIIAWSVGLASSAFAGTPAQWVGLRVGILERVSETDCTFGTVSTCFIPMNTGGSKQFYQGERRIHSRYAIWVLTNQSGASRTLDWKVWAKVV